MKKTLIKIISIVLVLCTLITICIIPASASESSISYFNDYFPLDLVSFRQKGSTDYVDINVSKLGTGNYATNSDIVFVKYENILLANGFDLIMFQSKKNLIKLEKDDIVTFNLSLLAPFCDIMGLFLYKLDGSLLDFVRFDRSSLIHTDNDVVRRLSGEPLAFGEKKLVYCHEYNLNFQYKSDGTDIYAVQIQAKFNDSEQVRKFWLCYENCTVTIDKAENETDFGFFSPITSFFNRCKNFFNKCLNFFLTIGETIVTPIKDIPENISKWFKDTFLGKVLQITNKTKTFVNNSGTGVQYAALNDEAGDSTENSQDWDMGYSPNYFIDVEYYSNQIPNVFDSGG